MTIYIKSEPSGEYSLGKISKEDLEQYGIIGNKEYDDTFEMDVINYQNLFQVYGVASSETDDWQSILGLDLNDDDFDNILNNSEINYFNVGEEYSEESDDQIATKLDSGYYVMMSAPSKYSAEFEIDIDEDNFDSSLLKLTFSNFRFPEMFSDSYGCVENSILTDIEYDGESYSEAYYDSMVDRGYRYEITVFEVNENKTYQKIWSNVE